MVGYDVFVTRATHHFDGAQVPIVEGDWRALLENDPELQAPDAALPSYAVWVGSGGSRSEWIDWANGNLFTRNPSPGLLTKLFEVAELLGAGLQGPDGAAFWRDEKGAVHPAAESAATTVVAEQDPASEPASSTEATGGLTEVTAEALKLGPKPRNAEQAFEVSEGRVADASFARGPEEVLAGDGDPAPSATMPFRVGQKVRTGWGQVATIISIDLDAEMGLGRIEIRYRDGRVVAMSCVSHGLRPVLD